MIQANIMTVASYALAIWSLRNSIIRISGICRLCLMFYATVYQLRPYAGFKTK